MVQLQSHPPMQGMEDVATTPSSLRTRLMHVMEDTYAGSSSHNLPAPCVDKNPQAIDCPADMEINRDITKHINSGNHSLNKSDIDLHKQRTHKLNDSTTPLESQLRKSTKQKRPLAKFSDYDLLFCEEAVLKYGD